MLLEGTISSLVSILKYAESIFEKKIMSHRPGRRRRLESLDVG